MEVDYIHNFEYDSHHQLLDFDYSLTEDPDNTYRNIVIERNNFENHYVFPYGTTWDDEEGYYEIDIDINREDSMVLEALTSYLDLVNEDNGELINM